MYLKFKHTLSVLSSRGFFHLLTANVLIQAVAFASQLFVAGILAPDDLGRIKVIMTFLSVFSIIGGMGFSGSTLKLCSENRSRLEVKTLFTAGIFFTIISTIAFYLLAILLNSFGFFSSDKVILWLIPIGLFPLITNSIFMVLVSYFQAIKEVKIMSRITVVNKIISIIAIVFLTWCCGIKGYYVAYNISFILMLIVGVRLIKTDITLPKKDLITNLKTHLVYSKPSLLSNLMSEISANADIFVINYLSTNMHEVGYYSFALTLTVALRIFPITVQQMAIPFFSGYSTNLYQFKEVFKKYNRQLYFVVFTTLTVALFISPIFLNTFFGGKYNATIPYFLLLAIGWSFRQLNQLQSAAIFGLGKIKYNVYISLISLIFNVLLCALLINKYGIIGAAWASIPGGIVIWLVSYLYMKKALKDK